ncbi:cytochrome P450 [Dendrothele bispora CBS 962.96]|uniref:Cytochrome P450 n=1 Tax=Dendrothele bispora (strain CBS 962.96) TaxID=1314807 RepID=A0A4S8L3S2_DENBC|nr:cytochrome P450 [Dendrothele bispora CBS 962.96]
MRRKLPPGPRGLPWLGNIFQLDKKLWRIFHEWKDVYGPIVTFDLCGQNMIVLNTHKVAMDLLDKRSAIYSDRPHYIVAGDYLCANLMLTLTRYGDLWRRMRRAANLTQSTVKKYHYTQEQEATLLARGLLNDTRQWRKNIERMSASIVISMIYAQPTLNGPNDPSIAMINDLVERGTHAMYPGSFLVEYLTFLDLFPESLAAWKRNAKQWYQRYTAIFTNLYLTVKDNVEDHSSSLCAKMALTKTQHQLEDHESAWLAASLYIAGFETTSSTLAWFLYAMTAFPDVQKRAQEELDRVVGRSRLPALSDMKNLPYVHAIVKEILRWRPVLPMGVSHASIEDDWYEGYFIPKGTILISNVWSMNRDQEIYGADADQFVPERHLDSKGELKIISLEIKEEGHVSYGFGRRVCIGRHVANNSLFIGAATILWSLVLKPELDIDGKPTKLEVNAESEHGVLSHPPNFGYVARPRFAESEMMLQQACDVISE